MDTAGKVAVVTGSAVGVGRATAVALAGRGCRVVVNYSRSALQAGETADLCRGRGVEARVVEADVSRDADCRRLIGEAVSCFGRVDILVNNAGTTEFIPFADLEALTEETWERILRTNLMGSFFCARAAVPSMRSAGAGAIVNVASIAGILGIGSSIAYAASKAALINMTRSLARALGPEIRVNAVAPGAIDTRWLRQGIGEKGYEALVAELEATTPLRGVAAPEDVADAIVWLALGARMTTGETIIVDAGYNLGPGARLEPPRS
jgi:3-oxoacyl-[acyl-carrier protein] reductase